MTVVGAMTGVWRPLGIPLVQAQPLLVRSEVQRGKQLGAVVRMGYGTWEEPSLCISGLTVPIGIEEPLSLLWLAGEKCLT